MAIPKEGMFPMLDKLMALFTKGEGTPQIDKDTAVNLITDRVALDAFDKSYRETAMAETKFSSNSFDHNSRDASEAVRTKNEELVFDEKKLAEVIDRAVNELVAQTPPALVCIESCTSSQKLLCGDIKEEDFLTHDDIKGIPKEVRPQLAGSLVSYDLAPDASRELILQALEAAFDETKPASEREMNYARFQQGLDILDLDPFMYEILGRNRNSMSYWLPAISFACACDGFFKIPKTRIAKVPLPILQLTRKEYGQLTPTTLKIVDDWAMKAFDLDVTKSYFIKTGCYSSKFDFRNCKVTGEKEVRELGEYLLYIQQQANYMAGPLTMPHPIIGVSTTNEWVVREYIEDVENNPTIYKGLPLHTEYRVFVDCDTDEILGYTPYWLPEGMKKHFGRDAEKNPHMYHDYVTFSTHEGIMTKRYSENIDRVLAHVKAMLPNIALSGQWSIDIMQNGEDFWVIDMAIASRSALNECVPAGKLKQMRDLIITPAQATEISKALPS